jgi:YfiH family protein
MEIIQLKVPQWGKYEGLLHGFIGRRGGKSIGPYAELNMSYRVSDDPKVVSQNVCDMKLAVGIHDGRIVTMRQVHGDNIVEVTDKTLKEAGEADGMLTGGADVYLGILTADCVPLLFVAPKQKLVAAVHAGWRGTLAGIAEKAVKLFHGRYGVKASKLEVALGPAIGACCYEVKDDVAGPLNDRWGSVAGSSIQIRDHKTYVDLRAINHAILTGAGVPKTKVFQIGLCTSCAADDFFSYRRQKSETGRQISFIGWLS